jgi:hypothetical protein
MRAVPGAADLDNWAQEAYSLDLSAAASLGFPVGSLTAGVQHRALMFGSSGWTDVVSGDRTYRFGVALRALVVVTDIKVSGDLMLPIVAAKVAATVPTPQLISWSAVSKAVILLGCWRIGNLRGRFLPST